MQLTLVHKMFSEILLKVETYHSLYGIIQQFVRVSYPMQINYVPRFSFTSDMRSDAEGPTLSARHLLRPRILTNIFKYPLLQYEYIIIKQVGIIIDLKQVIPKQEGMTHV